ncbi:MAG TPA: hypothetical protein VMT30_07595 [Candidatus Saccharimonadia bacterium]|nr:hypothetical protein [Candidatus Saccharimonadia bacterium]
MKRLSRARAGRLLVCATATVLLAGCIHGESTSTPAVPDVPTLNLAVASSRTSATVGFSTGANRGRTLDGEFAQQAAGGVHLARTDIQMSDVWRSRTTNWTAPSAWSAPDQVVTAAARHGQWLHALIDSPSSWSTDSSCGEQSWHCGPSGSPSDAQSGAAAYVRFAAAAAHRYCRALRTLEVLNEPNSLPTYWQHPDQYAHLFVAVAKAVHAACPSARVEPGGTAAVGTSNADEGYAPTEWYQDLCATDGYAAVGTIATLHPYTFPSTPADSDPNSQWRQLASVNNTLKTDCRIIGPTLDITEIGWPTAGGSRKPADTRYPEWQNHQPVTPYWQARFLQDAFDGVFILRHNDIKVGEVIVHQLRDAGSANDPDIEAHFGVTDQLGHPKPVSSDNGLHPRTTTAFQVVAAAAQAA